MMLKTVSPRGCVAVVRGLDKGQPACVGGPLASKPACSNALGCSDTPVFVLRNQITPNKNAGRRGASQEHR